jgi:hypothetical protein
MTWSFIHRETRSSLNDEDRTCMTNRALLMANDFGSRRLGRNPKAVRVRLSHLLECRAGNPIRLRYTEWMHPVLRTIRAGLGACTIVFDADDGLIRNRTWLTATMRLRTVDLPGGSQMSTRRRQRRRTTLYRIYIDRLLDCG